MSNRVMKKPVIIPELIRLIIIDLFCGAGGWTEGCEQAIDELGRRLAVVVAGVNHDELAIASHTVNHPETAHFVEDVRDKTLPRRIASIVQAARKLYPNAKVLLHGSLECTNFSNAKGGKSRNADSRSLAEFMPAYLKAIKPDYFTVENVREFMSWGPMIAKPNMKHMFEGYPAPVCSMIYHKKEKLWDYHWIPESRTKGVDYQRWVAKLCSMGYDFDFRLLNAADFGAYTSRLRYFAIFAGRRGRISWPQPTHSRRELLPKQMSLFGNLAPWKPVRDVLDFSDEGHSIFGRKTNMALRKQDRKDLVEKSLERIYAGLVKHVGNGDDSFLSKYYSGDPASKNISLDGPAGALTTTDSHAVVKAAFLNKYIGNNQKTGINNGVSINEPCIAVTTQDRVSLVQASFLSKYNGGSPECRNTSLSEPCGTLTTENRVAIVNANFLASYYSNSVGTTSMAEPAGTLTTKDRLSLVQAVRFVDQQYGNSKPSSVEEPAGTVTANPKLNLVTADRFMVNYYSEGCQTQALDEPTTALTTIPKQRFITLKPGEGFLTNPGWFGNSSDLDNPSPTIVARQDKAPVSVVRTMLVNNQHANVPTSTDEPAPTLTTGNHHYLVITQNGDLAIQILPGDSPATVKIKQFMAAHGIIDIKMRMLNVPELKRIQGFPDSYVLKGGDTKKKKFIGNSVVPPLAQRMIEAIAKGGVA